MTALWVWGLYLGCTSGRETDHKPPSANEIQYRESILEAGSFELGAFEHDPNAFAVEKPVSMVTFKNSLAFGTMEVTQMLWRQITGRNPSKYKRCGDECPVENVNFCDVVLFANDLSRAKGLSSVYDLPKDISYGSKRLQCNSWAGKITVDWSKNGYRLPTEAEWEYAAKAESENLYSGGNDLSVIDSKVAKTDDSSSHPVGQTLANAWGILGMSGNVWEWVWDPYQSYSKVAKTDPDGGASNGYRVFRGGGWSNADNYTRINCTYCRRVTHRGSVDPGFSGGMLGFRLARRLD